MLQLYNMRKKILRTISFNPLVEFLHSNSFLCLDLKSQRISRLFMTYFPFFLKFKNWCVDQMLSLKNKMLIIRRIVLIENREMGKVLNRLAEALMWWRQDCEYLRVAPASAWLHTPPTNLTAKTNWICKYLHSPKVKSVDLQRLAH